VRHGRLGARDVRIAHVTPGYPPDQGGVETVVGSLATELAAAGHRVSVLTQAWTRGQHQPGVSGDNPRVARFRDLTGSKHFRTAPGLWKAVRDANHKVDIFHAHSYHSSVSLATALLAKKPWVFSPYYHGPGHTAGAKLAHGVYGPMTAALFARAAALICISRSEAAAVAQAFPGSEDKIVIITPGIDLVAIESAVAFDTEPPVVLSACRLEEYKQVDVLLRAFRGVRDARLVILGTGPTLPALRLLARQLGMEDRTTIRGQVSEAELRRWQRTARVTVSLSTHESLGLTQLEAAVAGSTMVASRITAHEEVASMTGQATLLIRPDIEPTELAEVLVSALARSRPAPSRRGIPTWTGAAEATARLYERVASASGPA
jgi:glycosyltransferase involved in cell wall biosynthesis